MTFLVAVLRLADVTCGESSHEFHDGALVAQVAVNRVHARGKPLLRVLRRGQFARGCIASGKRKRFHPRHVLLAVEAMAGVAESPPWFGRDVLFFCAETGKPTSGCARWRARGSWAKTRLRPAGTTRRESGRVVHRYWSDRRLGDG